jgi:hypothetical protein
VLLPQASLGHRYPGVLTYAEDEREAVPQHSLNMPLVIPKVCSTTVFDLVLSPNLEKVFDLMEAFPEK